MERVIGTCFSLRLPYLLGSRHPTLTPVVKAIVSTALPMISSYAGFASNLVFVQILCICAHVNVQYSLLGLITGIRVNAP